MEERKHIPRIHEDGGGRGKKRRPSGREREKCLRMATAAGKDVKNCFLIFASSSRSAVGLHRFVSFSPILKIRKKQQEAFKRGRILVERVPRDGTFGSK